MKASPDPLSAELLREQAELLGVDLDGQALADLCSQLAALLSWAAELPDPPAEAAPATAPPPWAADTRS